MCDAFRGEIIIGRQYYPDDRSVRDTEVPGFVAAHELAHILDTRLGKYVDPYGEDPPSPTSKVDSYVQLAYLLDQSIQSEFAVRSGLLSGDNKGFRSDAVEIICDLIAHA